MVFRDTLSARTISLMLLPFNKCSRLIRPIVSTTSIPRLPRFLAKQALKLSNIPRRLPPKRGQFCTPKNSEEHDPLLIQPIELLIGGKLGIEDEMLW